MEKITLKNLKTKRPKECEEWLVSNGYIYNKTFGWETIETIEKFNLNPNMKGVPRILKNKWVQKADGNQIIKDEFGNKKKVVGDSGWERHPVEKEWQISDNWLAYMEFKKGRDKQYEMEEQNRLISR